MSQQGFRQLAKESNDLINRLYLQPGTPDYLPVDDLAYEMKVMGEEHAGIWTEKAIEFKRWLSHFRALPTIQPGNLHPLPDVDARMRPERYRA